MTKHQIPIAVLVLSVLTTGGTILLAALGHEGQIPVLVGVLGPVLASLLTAHLEQVKGGVEDVRHQTNALKDELVAATDRSARAEGRIEGRAEPRNHK